MIDIKAGALRSHEPGASTSVITCYSGRLDSPVGMDIDYPTRLLW